MFQSVLIANRGEIAVRIARTLRRLGIRSVAVHSDADAGALHVRTADIAMRIGPAAAVDSYLRADRIVDAAIAAGADAVHPGYGFLSESVALVDACAAAGLVFIGPPRAAIDAMGDKIRAKATVARAGVRVVPGSEQSGLTDDALVAAANEAGFPVLIKPSAGGGGKGMHLVRDAAQMRNSIAAARREARSAFGNDDLLVERFVDRPRHIEIQVLADGHGNVVHLGERECSLQRRHQKIVEEAPSPYLTDERRSAIGDQAVAAARACGYVNAGTVEFIVSGSDPADAFFMEMNTRLQVEHPVTELVWGLDLVEWQLRIAAGEALGFTQADLRPSGHAIEARVYGEDPRRGFLPTGGRVVVFDAPTGDGVRIDSGIASGDLVGGDYDPMLAKVIAVGADRATALRRLDRALADTALLGVTANIAFLRALLAHPGVVAGDLDTGLVERDLDSLVDRTVPADAIAAAALSAVAQRQPCDAWELAGGWRVGERAWSRWTADVDGSDESVIATVCGVVGAGSEIKIGSADAVAVDVRRVEPDATSTHRASSRHFDVTVAGRTTRVVVARDGTSVWVARDGATWSFREHEAVRPSASSGTASSTGAVTSPMPGTVVAVPVSTGDAVAAGAALVVVEAMKMEHTVVASTTGIVAELPVAVGQKVALGQLLARIDSAGAEEDR